MGGGGGGGGKGGGGSIAKEHVSVAMIKSNLYLDLTQLVHEFSVFFSQ